MKQFLTTFSIVLCGTALAAGEDGNNSNGASINGRVKVIGTGRGALSFGPAPRIFGQTNSFVETYDDGTDVGLLALQCGCGSNYRD